MPSRVRQAVCPCTVSTGPISRDSSQFSGAVGPWPCGLLKKLVHWLLPLASHMGLSQTIRRPWKDVQEESVLDIHGV